MLGMTIAFRIAGERETPEKRIEEGTMNEKRVLLIDDEASLRRSVALGLLQKGYETNPCESGMKGLQALESSKEQKNLPNYVVLDVRLPDIDGLKLLKVIKLIYPEVPVVMITGYGNDATASDARLDKADAYLEKPFTIDELTRIFAEIPQKSAVAAAAIEESAEPDREKAVSVYVLMNFSDTANLSEVYQEMYFMENVLYCDAIKGDFDMALLLQAGKLADLQALVENKIKKLPGAKDICFMPVDSPQLSDSANNIIGSMDKVLGREKGNAGNASFSKSASSYVFLEIEKDKLESIFPTLYLNDQVVSCDYIKGKYDIVVLMQGASFAEIDRNIQAKIKPLDGVLRIQEMPIIKLFEM
jgi:DNA-binding response OmpR family regulator